MKKAIVALLAVAFAPAVLAQGSFNFNNYGGGVVTVIPGGAYAGSEWQVQAFWGPVGAAEVDFTAIGSPIALFGNTGGNPGSDGAGLYDGGTINVGQSGLGTVQVQVRAVAGPGSFDSAASRSAIVSQAVADGTALPSDLNTPAWSIVVPEPSTFALAGLGAAALLIFRRRD